MIRVIQIDQEKMQRYDTSESLMRWDDSMMNSSTTKKLQRLLVGMPRTQSTQPLS
jgi:hypothetical protein